MIQDEFNDDVNRILDKTVNVILSWATHSEHYETWFDVVDSTKTKVANNVNYGWNNDHDKVA
jgi:hypothetical protein